LGGYSNSNISGDKTEASQGGYDYWIVKLSATGTIQWQSTIGGNDYDYLQSIQQTTDGGYILGGYSYSGISGNKTEASQGGFDYWVVKLSANGTIEWQNTIGGSGDDYLQSIQQTTDGGYILGGYSQSGVSGDKTEACQGNYDYWVVKLTTTSAIEWQNTIGGSGDDRLQSIQQTTDGGYILGGYSESGISGDKTKTSQGDADYWVVKIAATGTIEWQNTIGGSIEDYLLSIQQTTDGGYILGGYSRSGISGDKTEANQGSSDYWVVKLSATGTIQWQNTIGGSSNDYLQSIQQTTDGGYILGGYSNSNISGDKTETSQGDSDYWVVKLTGTGTIEWQNTIGGSGDDRLQSIQQTTNGGYILGGYSNSSIYGDKIEISQGYEDYWILKLPSITFPISNFEIPINTCINQAIHFTNYSTNASNYQWEINDTPITTMTDLDYTFTTSGTYTITLISNNPTCSSRKSQVVQIIDPYDFSYVQNGVTINFFAETGANEYSWNLGDETTSIGQNIIHTYLAEGTYEVCLSSNTCESLNTCRNIVVTQLPKCVFTPTIQWQNTIGGNSNDELQSIQQTTDGGYILGGYSNSNVSGDKTEASLYNDYWIVKLSVAGTIEWQNAIGGNQTDYLQSIQQTTDGGYILGGTSNSDISGDKTEPSQGNDDYWVVKLTATGAIEWQNTIGGSSIDRLKSIQQTTDGGYILGGYTASGISGDKTEALQGAYDYWIIKLTATGTIEWQNTIGGNNYDYLESIQQTTDGGYILGGYSASGISGDKTEASQGYEDYWVIKLTTTGAIEWQNTIGGSSGDYLRSIQQTTDGGYILGGYSNSGISGDKTEANQGSFDYWVIKLAATGAIEWQNTIGGSSNDYLQSIQQTTDGGYILGGYTASGISGDKTEANQGSFDYWVVKLAATGNIQWQNTIGGSSVDYLSDIQQTTDGGYILGGYSQSGISGDKTETSQGYTDYWVVKISGISTNPTIASFTLATNNLPTNSPYTYLYNPTNFTNLSSNATSYQWQIDGIPISTNTNLNYTFNTSGSHIVSLIASNEECSNMYSKTIVVLDAVWPGDANADGTVNMLDYLALGIAYNYVAIPRLEQNIDWNAKFATNFNQTFGGNLFANTNYKHSDCNGNGTINFADTTAILQNFGLSYLPATTLAPSVSPQALVSVEANTPYVAASTVAYLNIKLQNALDNNNSVNLYGMAFSIDYTGASNPQLDFTGSCLGTLGTDFIASYKIDDANKKIHVGITRFNHNNSLALGTVATLQLNINALPTGTSLAIGTEDIVLCDNEGYRIPAAAGVAANMQVQTSALPVMLQAKALLQCAITDLNVGNALMTTEFNSTLPTQQPFNAAPWNYTGTESGTIPANAVDWVLVDLRNSANINQVVARKAVLLLNDGSLQDVGTPLQNNRVAFAGLASNQSYFVVLRHHSHQTIASSAAVPVSNNLMSIDFTQSADQTNGGAASLAYINGWYALKLVLTPTLSGNTAVCSGTTQTYTNSTPVAGVTYTWTATGGSIVSGQGGNSVQIQWANGTSGTLTLTAEERLCSEVASASITVSLTPDAIVTVGGTAAGGGTPGLTSYNLCPTCKVYLKSNYTNLTNYTLKWYKNNNELTQYQNYLGGNVKKAGNYKLKVIRNSTGCEDFSQTVSVTGGAPMLTDNNNPNINNTPSMGKEEEMLFESENLELFVYPNPAQNRVTIAYNIADNSQLSLKIYDIMGQLQHTQTLAISNNTLDVDVSTYPSGTYLVQLLGDKASVVSYLMVVK
jgi:PKD repeat protein